MRLKARCRMAAVAAVAIVAALAAVYELTKPIPNGCVMTYMYPTYVPVAPPRNASGKYGLFLYHEGWQPIDFAAKLRDLDGVPVLFIPGNGGSYKQVRSLAAESSRAYQNGPFEPTFYQESSILPGSSTTDELDGFTLPSKYSKVLDWFAVDLEGERSAMDGGILAEHTDFVVHAVNRVLDQYKESFEARSAVSGDVSASLPSSVILVGHSMGGFVARAALLHPQLRKSAVGTIITLSSPHQYPPVALQPALGQYFAWVNAEWRQGYKSPTSRSSGFAGTSKLSNVVVVSVSGGIRDYQVRLKSASLDGIVPSSHGFTIGSSVMKNVWLPVEHQSILWCNQLVVQVSHTLLSLIDPASGQAFQSTQRRLFVLTKMLRSVIPEAISRVEHVPHDTQDVIKPLKQFSFGCPQSISWRADSLEKDLYIQTCSVTVLAMDGKRRWLDIRKLGSDGKGHFVFVTNLAPCSGVKIHLWPEKQNLTSQIKSSPSKRNVDITSKMVQIPAGPSPRQVEPGSQTEQPGPSSFLILNPEDLAGFRFITISVAPRQTISGRPPPGASMAVGQFFNPKDGSMEYSVGKLLRSSYFREEVLLKEDHPLALNFSFSLSLGVLPINLSVNTAGCGIKDSDDQLDKEEQNKLCKLRCFPPVAFAWDSSTGLHVLPQINAQTIVVDSSPALWDSTDLEKTSLFLLADPHCSYKVALSVSTTAAASRFVLLYSSQICGFILSTIFFALMRQACAWEHDSPVPSVLTAIEMNLRVPHQFFLIWFSPVIILLGVSLFRANKFPPFASFCSVTVACFIVANGFASLLVLGSKIILHATASINLFAKRRQRTSEDVSHSTFLHELFKNSNMLAPLKILQVFRNNPNIIMAFFAFLLVCFIHPALGLGFLVIIHAFYAHSALSSYFVASSRVHSNKELDKITGNSSAAVSGNSLADRLQHPQPRGEIYPNSPTSGKSFADYQLELFNYRHGIMMLHLLATLMFSPSFIAWLKQNGLGQNFPMFTDSVVSLGIILHALFGSKLDADFITFPLPSVLHMRDTGLSLLYLLAGYYSLFGSMSLLPYKALYAAAAVGMYCFISRIAARSKSGSSPGSRRDRKHSHRH